MVCTHENAECEHLVQLTHIMLFGCLLFRIHAYCELCQTYNCADGSIFFKQSLRFNLFQLNNRRQLYFQCFLSERSLQYVEMCASELSFRRFVCVCNRITENCKCFGCYI